MRCSLLAILTFVISGALNQATFATVVYSDDFQDETLGATFPAIGGSNVGDPYVAFDNPGGTSHPIYQTRGTHTIVANPELNGNTSSQVFRGVRENSTTAPQFVRVAALFAGGSAVLDGLSLSVDFYNPTPGTANTNNGVRLAFLSSIDPVLTDPFGSRPSVNTGTKRDVITFLEADGTTQIDGAPDVGVNYLADAWQNFNLTLVLNDNLSTATEVEYTANWKLTNLETAASISGSKVVNFTTANFDNSGLGGRGLMFEFAGAPNNVVYVDNLSVTAIPEPVAFLFGSVASCLGGLASLIRQKRAVS